MRSETPLEWYERRLDEIDAWANKRVVLRHLDLFSGIGGFALAARWVGWETVAFCEIDPFCRKVLRKHWPEVPIYEDIKQIVANTDRQRCGKAGSAEGWGWISGRSTSNGTTTIGPIDIITGGFPCQDISHAGKGAGIDGPQSGLWSELARLIGEVRPRYAILENVSALLGRGLDRVTGDLAEIGYDCEWHCIPASAIGAPHRRDRVWIIAYPQHPDADQPRLEGRLRQIMQECAGEWAFGEAGSSDRRETFWDTGADVCRVANGVPRRVDRLRGLGNAIVPQVAEVIFRAIQTSEA